MSDKLDPFEWRFAQTLKDLGLHGQSVMMACSGGMDSTVLAALCARVAGRLQLELSLAYVHHGREAEREVLEYRHQAQALVAQLARRWGWRFFSAEIGATSKDPSEAWLRERRYELLHSLMQEAGAHCLLLAHHRQDQAETQLMRLIRGTSLTGLQSMKSSDGLRLRPLLAFSRAEIENYARKSQLVWCEDPSNQKPTNLRNWLRQVWLPQLEAQYPGSLARLEQSLMAIAEEGVEKTLHLPEFQNPDGSLHLARLQALPQNGRRQILALYLRGLGCRDYTRGQLSEIVKRLDSTQGRLNFSVCGLDWVINAEQLWARHPSKR